MRSQHCAPFHVQSSLPHCSSLQPVCRKPQTVSGGATAHTIGKPNTMHQPQHVHPLALLPTLRSFFLGCGHRRFHKTGRFVSELVRPATKSACGERFRFVEKRQPRSFAFDESPQANANAPWRGSLCRKLRLRFFRLHVVASDFEPAATFAVGRGRNRPWCNARPMQQ